MKILFVCLGNICRSPMAHGILHHLATKHGLQWQIDSAGTNSYHTGEAPHPSSQQVCTEHGIDISTQRARTFNRLDMLEFDIIYVLAQDVYDDVKKISGHDFNTHKVKFLLDELFPNESRSVKDPWYGAIDGYYPVFDEIYACCEKIIERYA
ncbi:MAG: low molecular weight protein-tyrosine-phosphatase [Chitinophagaceae bacterium]